MSTPSENSKTIISQADMNRLYRDGGWEQIISGCDPKLIRDESFSPEFRDTIRKEHLEYYSDGELVAIVFRYTRKGGEIRISPKMLLVDGVRHCS